MMLYSKGASPEARIICHKLCGFMENDGSTCIRLPKDGA
jgi:hypothetical protein